MTQQMLDRLWAQRGVDEIAQRIQEMSKYRLSMDDLARHTPDLPHDLANPSIIQHTPDLAQFTTRRHNGSTGSTESVSVQNPS